MSKTKADETWAINCKKEQIQNFAEQLRQGLNLDTKTIKDVVTDLNGQIVIKNPFDDDSEDESMVVNYDRTFKIILPCLTSAYRDNFTIAHELGHFFLHYTNKHTTLESNTQVLFNRYGSNRLEWEANWFAAALLMPKEEFLKIAKKYASDEHIGIAAHFSVSEKAVEIRKKDLGLL